MKLFRALNVITFLVVSSRAAIAHAIVLGSTPRSDETVKGQELSIEIRFNSRIDAGRSNIKLFKPQGPALSLEILDSVSPDTLKAKAIGLTPGRYRAHWQTLSPDGHITQGDIPFSISR
jgi:copper resistance protein C